jgi:hypothetical protein
MSSEMSANTQRMYTVEEKQSVIQLCGNSQNATLTII